MSIINNLKSPKPLRQIISKTVSDSKCISQRNLSNLAASKQVDLVLMSSQKHNSLEGLQIADKVTHKIWCLPRGTIKVIDH